MRRHRWPALAPPTTGGITLHAGMPIAAEKDLTLKLCAVTAFASELALRFALCVTGVRADFARHETRPLTDPHDWSAQWSYLVVPSLVDDLGGLADPFHPVPDSGLGGSGPYRTTPQYWIGTYPSTGSLTVTFCPLFTAVDKPYPKAISRMHERCSRGASLTAPGEDWLSSEACRTKGVRRRGSSRINLGGLVVQRVVTGVCDTRPHGYPDPAERPRGPHPRRGCERLSQPFLARL